MILLTPKDKFLVNLVQFNNELKKKPTPLRPQTSARKRGCRKRGLRVNVQNARIFCVSDDYARSNPDIRDRGGEYFQNGQSKRVGVKKVVT